MSLLKPRLPAAVCKVTGTSDRPGFCKGFNLGVVFILDLPQPEAQKKMMPKRSVSKVQTKKSPEKQNQVSSVLSGHRLSWSSQIIRCL